MRLPPLLPASIYIILVIHWSIQISGSLLAKLGGEEFTVIYLLTPSC